MHSLYLFIVLKKTYIVKGVTSTVDTLLPGSRSLIRRCNNIKQFCMNYITNRTRTWYEIHITTSPSRFKDSIAEDLYVQIANSLIGSNIENKLEIFKILSLVSVLIILAIYY